MRKKREKRKFGERRQRENTKREREKKIYIF